MIPPPTQRCYLKEGDKCCCNCKYRLQAIFQDKAIGSICVAIAFFIDDVKAAYIADVEHGLCEGHQITEATQ